MQCAADTQETAVSHNIQKASRTVYSFLGSGLQWRMFGLDLTTSIHLLQTYLPVLVYWLESNSDRDVGEDLQEVNKTNPVAAGHSVHIYFPAPCLSKIS